MGSPEYHVTVGEETRLFEKGTTFREIVNRFQKPEEAKIILVMVNGKLTELGKTLEKNCTLTFVRVTDSIGFHAYRRTAVLLLLKAIADVSGSSAGDQAVMNFSHGNALYGTLKDQSLCTDEFFQKVQERMRELVDLDLPIVKRKIHTDEAIAMFAERNMKDKERLFHYRRNSSVNIYDLGGFVDYFYGYMADRTSVVDTFALEKCDRGFVLILPERSTPGVLKAFEPRRKLFRVQQESEDWGDTLHVGTVSDLNDRISREGVRSILLAQEALQEAKIAEIAAQIHKRGNVRFVMIAGPSSSGKTSFSHRLSIQLQAAGLRPHPVAVDNYFVNRDQTPLDEYGEKDYECLDAIDVKQFNEDMLALLNGERVELPVYNFVAGQREYKGDYLQLGEEDILVIEGIHGLNDALSYALPKESKFKIYISALTQLNVDEHNRIPTTDGRLIRRMVRDARTRGISASETIARWPSVRRGEERFIFPFQEEADVMFNSSLVYELACLKVYAEPLLFGIPRNAPEYLEAKRLLKFFDYFVPVPGNDVPNNSLLREFIGGSIFNV